MLKLPLATVTLLTATAASATADTVVLKVPSQQYPTIAAAVAAAKETLK